MRYADKPTIEILESPKGGYAAWRTVADPAVKNNMKPNPVINIYSLIRLVRLTVLAINKKPIPNRMPQAVTDAVPSQIGMAKFSEID